MSALLAPSQTYAPRFDPCDWIEAGEAARVLDISEGQMRRKCAVLESQGMACKAAPGGGLPRWFLARRYHPAFDPRKQELRGKVAEGFFRLPRAKQNEAWARVACVEALRKLRTSGDQLKHKIDGLILRLRTIHPIRISKTSLYRWDSVYRTPADVARLVDTRGGDHRSMGDPAAWAFFRDLFLDRRAPEVKKVYDLTAAKAEAEEWEWPSIATVRRRLDEVIPPEVQLYHRDRTRWLSQMQPGIEQDAEAWAAGTLWESDHAQLDCMCRFGKENLRPWITAWMDWRTRRIVGYVLSTAPNGSTIQAALKHALDDPANLGGPDVVRIDNGKDYQGVRFHGVSRKARDSETFLRRGYLDEATFKGIFGLLNIDVIFTIPRGPNGKSRTERWFEIMHKQFDKDFETYAGRNSASRPFGHGDVMKSASKVPTFERLKHDLDEYVAAYNASADHEKADLTDDAGTRMSPDTALACWGRTREGADPEVIAMALGQEWQGTVTANRNGITIRPYGVPVSYGGFDVRLTAYKARHVKDRPPLAVSYDPHDPGHIRVWTADFKTFLGVFKENEKGGGMATDPAKAKELIGQKRSYAKSLRLVKEEEPRQFMTPGERLRFNEKQRRKREETVDPAKYDGPRPVRLVQTPLDGHSKRVQVAEARMAAGAEGHHVRPLPDLSKLMRRSVTRSAAVSGGGAGVTSGGSGGVHVDLSGLTGGG